MPDKKKKSSSKAYSSEGQMKAADGYKMTIKPKAGESASKNLTVGRASTTVKLGIYAPAPTTSAKFSAPTKIAKKSNYKAPSARKTGMKSMSKMGSKRGGMKCY